MRQYYFEADDAEVWPIIQADLDRQASAIEPKHHVDPPIQGVAGTGFVLQVHTEVCPRCE